MEKVELSFESNHVHRNQRSLLSKALEETASGGSRRVSFIGGPSGSGKTQLVRSSFTEDQESSKCWFATAKFEQRGNWAPLSVIRSLVVEIVRQVMHSRPSRVEACRAALESEFSALPGNREILVDVVPASLDVFGGVRDGDRSDVDSSATYSTDDVSSTRLAIRSFFRAISSVLPVVLFLDDVMWSDKDTLELIEFLLTDDSIGNLLFCGTYRDDLDDEEEKSRPFFQWHERILAEFQEVVRTIEVKNLEAPEIQCLLSDLLLLDEDEVAKLAELLKTRTNGNLFHLEQMLKKFCSMGLLKYEYVGYSYKWTYSLGDIQRLTPVSDNVGELVSFRIKELEKPLQNLLKLAACFGSRVEVRALETIRPAMLDDIVDIRSLLDRACQEMIMIRVSENTCKFAHDEIQAAAYALLSSSEEAKQIHQHIGNLLLHNVSTLQDQTLTFACADQLKRGFDSFENNKNRVAIAKLSLAAGKRAAAISAFMMASDFFQLGINALGGPLGFDVEYNLAVKLYSLYARTEQCGGSIDESKKAAEVVLAHATTEESKVSAFRTLLSCFLAANQMDELIDFGLDLCMKLGEKIAKNPKPRKVKHEMEKGRKVLLKRSNAQILSLPRIEDKSKELCMNVLFELALPAYYVGNHLLHYSIVTRMNKITLEHGLSKWSPRSFALSGQHFTANYSDFKEGYRYAQLALILLEDYKRTKQGGSVLFIVAIIKACIEPATSGMDLLLTGYKISMEAGHINSAVTNIFNYFWTFFYSGLPFEPLLDDLEKFSKQMLDYKRSYWFLLTLPVWQCLLNLSGRSEDGSNMEAGEAIEKESLVGGNPKGVGRQTLMSYWMQLSFYLGKMEKATELYEQVKDFDMGFSKATMFFNARVFFFALIEMHNFRVSGKRKCWKNAKKYRDVLRKHVSGGAINLVSKVQVLDAEMTKRKKDNTKEVLQMYRGAVASAARSGFLQDAALIHFLCANYCQGVNSLEHEHEMHLQKAHEYYISWGALEVARSLKSRYPRVFRRRNSSSSLGSFTGRRSAAKYEDTAGIVKRHSAGFSDLDDSAEFET